MRGVTEKLLKILLEKSEFQLTRLMRGVTAEMTAFKSEISISTHTPHARRDLLITRLKSSAVSISTHTPHARRDCVLDEILAAHDDFNSHASCEA